MKGSDTGPTAYRYLSEKTGEPNHLQMLFEDPDCWSSRAFEPATSHTVARCSTN